MATPLFSASGSPATTTGGSVVGTGTDELVKFLMNHLANQNQQPANNGLAGLDKLISAAKGDTVGASNRTTGLPSYNPESTSPFKMGFFQGANQRADNETAMLGTRGSINATPAERLGAMQQTDQSIANSGSIPAIPRQNVQGTTDTTPTQPSTNPTVHPSPFGGLEGMINPGAPDATKYSDANMFQIHPISGHPTIQPSGGGPGYVNDGSGWHPLEPVTGMPIKPPVQDPAAQEQLAKSAFPAGQPMPTPTSTPASAPLGSPKA